MIFKCLFMVYLCFVHLATSVKTLLVKERYPILILDQGPLWL